jgi:hypothetical protein
MRVCSLQLLRQGFCFTTAVIILAVVPRETCAQINNGGLGFFQQAVGGVSVDADGVLGQPIAAGRDELRQWYLKGMKPIPEALQQPTEMRMVSLRALEAALAKTGAANAEELPTEIRYLAGIQRAQFLFVYPDSGDIVLAGPGEPWKVDEAGNVVGVTSGRPTLRLEDLLLALRTVENARQGGISVSIDPTEEGRLRLDGLLAGKVAFSQELLNEIEKTLGPQRISLRGVPESSRFARTLVASDYKMKRIAMNLDPSPVKGLVSYLDLLKSPPKNMMPRWWMACDYEPLAKSDDGLAWELRGKGVKVLTEDEIVSQGKVKGTGKASGPAQRWADAMTSKYEQLMAKEPVFGDLRNLMDLCVLAAVIRKEDLLAKARLELPTLTEATSKLGFVDCGTPKTVATQCSAMKRGRDFIITASGGVEINSWAIADKTTPSPQLNAVREKAAAKKESGLY